MNKKEKQFIKFATDYCNKLSKTLLLDSFTPIEVSFDKVDRDSMAEATFNFPYKSIKINCNKEILKEDLQSQKETLVHEMCHAITDPLYSSAFDRFITKGELSNRREELTDHIANIIIKNKLS